MIFKPKAIELIKAGLKTQTRRPVKPGEWLSHPVPFDPRLEVVDRNHRSKWTVGHRYSLCPGRGAPRVGLMRLTGIRQEALGLISDGDAHAEGFESRNAFLEAWSLMYPKSQPEDLVWVLEFDRN
jgi:hypothetical protein